REDQSLLGKRFRGSWRQGKDCYERSRRCWFCGTMARSRLRSGIEAADAFEEANQVLVTTFRIMEQVAFEFVACQGRCRAIFHRTRRERTGTFFHQAHFAEDFTGPDKSHSERLIFRTIEHFDLSELNEKSPVARVAGTKEDVTLPKFQFSHYTTLQKDQLAEFFEYNRTTF